jgi:septin family protein
MFKKAIKANGETMEANIINLFCFTFKDNIFKWGEIFVQNHPNCTFEELEQAFYKQFKTMKSSTCNYETYNKKSLNVLKFIMKAY